MKIKLSLACTLILLSGCARYKDSADWSDAQSPKYNKVEKTSRIESVRFEPLSMKLEKNYQKRLEEQLDLFGRRKSVYWELQYLAGSVLGKKRAELIEKMFKSHGVSVKRMDLVDIPYDVMKHQLNRGSVNEEVGKDSVLLKLTHYLVISPICPDWTEAVGSGSPAEPMRNLGCATNTALGAMVSDPNDLLNNPTKARDPGVRSDLAESRYRTGQVQPLGNSVFALRN